MVLGIEFYGRAGRKLDSAAGGCFTAPGQQFEPGIMPGPIKRTPDNRRQDRSPRASIQAKSGATNATRFTFMTP